MPSHRPITFTGAPASQAGETNRGHVVPRTSFRARGRRPVAAGRASRKLATVVAASALTALTLLTLVGPAAATQPSGTGAVAPSQRGGPSDAAELGSFLDDLLATQMEDFHIAGAAVSVVKDGELLFAKGYGYADIERGVPVDPDRTMFAIGSLTKLFTWTAVMQLVEQGRLDLDADINRYLDFPIPATFPQPITLKHLLTHTSGFEDRLIGTLTADARELVVARQWLISNMAVRTQPPGAYAGYSNYNAELAGYIVARVSGQPFDRYVQANILDALAMRHSTAESPTPAAMMDDRSVGYTYSGGAFHAFPGYEVQAAGLPSGGMETSATDMARFMIAHLEGGAYRDEAGSTRRILGAATARQMGTTLYAADAHLLGTAYGFFDITDNGQRTLGHQGYMPPMHSLLMLLPDQGVGVFVTYNSGGAGRLTLQHTGFQRAFFDHYYPAPQVEPIRPPADFAERADRFVGSYRYASAPATTLSKLGAFVGAYTVEVSNPGDGTLLVTMQGVSERFAEVEPLRFRQVDGPFSLVFGVDSQGRISRLVSDLAPQYAALRVDWYETADLNATVLLGLTLVFAAVISASVLRAVWRRLGRRPAADLPRGARIASLTIVVLSALNLAVVAGTFTWVMQPSELHNPEPALAVVLGFGVVSTLLTAGAAVFVVLAWRDRYWGFASRVGYSLTTVAAVAFVWFLNYWNLLGWRY